MIRAWITTSSSTPRLVSRVLSSRFVLAARQLTSTRETEETAAHKRVRLWDSLSVTYELAAAAVLGAAWHIGGTLVAGTLALLIVGVGVFLYAKYVIAFRDLPKHDRHQWDLPLAWLTVLPVTALIAALAGFAGWGLLPTNWPTVLVAGVVSWLVFSGTAQALYWYYNSWE